MIFSYILIYHVDSCCRIRTYKNSTIDLYRIPALNHLGSTTVRNYCLCYFNALFILLLFKENEIHDIDRRIMFNHIRVLNSILFCSFPGQDL